MRSGWKWAVPLLMPPGSLIGPAGCGGRGESGGVSDRGAKEAPAAHGQQGQLEKAAGGTNMATHRASRSASRFTGCTARGAWRRSPRRCRSGKGSWPTRSPRRQRCGGHLRPAEGEPGRPEAARSRIWATPSGRRSKNIREPPRGPNEVPSHDSKSPGTRASASAPWVSGLETARPLWSPAPEMAEIRESTGRRPGRRSSLAI